MNKYMTEIQARKAICDIGDKMYIKGFVAANDGNISVKISDDTIIVTPTGVSKGGMTPASLVKMKLDGTVLGDNKPSSEVKMHIRVYRLNQTVNSVVHAHPPGSTAFAIARIPMDRPIMSESIVTLGVVPVADYALPGTEEVPNSIEPFINSHNAVLLANHGLLTWGESLTQAWYRMETAEQYSNIMTRLKSIGEPKEFSSSQINDLINIRKNMGIESGGVPSCKSHSESDLNADSKAEHQEELIEKIIRQVLSQLK
ncbi:MAG: class II aldolase/adducin family protein [Spirochaetales bacterium]|nr:class II aldolase/adducin family protein [Spirochaetales bacterium]